VVREGPAGKGLTRCLLVRTGEVQCAIPLHQVRRVARALRVSPVPGAAPELLGIAEYSGEPIAVFDLARLVDAPPGANPEYPVTVVATIGGESGELAGLSADAALRFVDLAEAMALPTAVGVVQGEVVIEGEPVRLLDLARLGVAP